MTSFDPDALLAALPRRSIRPLPPSISLRSARARAVPISSAVGEKGEYNGFSDRERYRTADLSNWLCKVGSVDRAQTCDICRSAAEDEHAENYYDLSTWVGLCRRCHRNMLHKRNANSMRWFELLDGHELPDHHWARLISGEPFDLAALLRSRGLREPVKSDFRHPVERGAKWELPI